MNLSEEMQTKITDTLETYQTSAGTDVNAGFNILRYAEAGYLTVNTSKVNATLMFIEQYPANAGFVILRLAKAGQLEMVKSVDKKEKTANKG